jgi:hypothetical protein
VSRFAPVTDGQVPALVALWEACGMTRPWNPPLPDIAELRASPAAALLVAGEGARVIASVACGHDGHRGWVYYLATDPARRGEGLGRAAMAAAEAWLRARGAAKMQLMVRESNEAVMGFYAALGYGDDKVRVLSKWLDPVRARAYEENSDAH